MYLLDTATVIDFLVGAPEAKRVVNSLQGTVAFSAVSIAELWRTWDKNRSDNQRVVREFLAALTIIPFDERAGIASAELSAVLGSIKIPLGDRLLAGTAIATGATIVTRDAHFTRIAGITVLSY